MPGIPLVARQASSYCRSTQQMCRQDSHMQSPVEEEIASEESLSIYCKPVEFYNILQRRSTRNVPTFLQRCLRYKIQAKHKKRIRLTLSASELVNGGLHANSQFPFYVLLGRHISNNAVREHSFNYSFNRVCILTSAGEGRNMEAHANFVLPEANKFASEAKYRSLSILILSWGSGLLASKDHPNMTSTLLDAGQLYLCGIIPLEELYSSWEKSVPFSLGYRAEVTSTIDMHSCLLKWGCLKKGKFVAVHIPSNSGNMIQQVKVNIFAEEIGTIDKSPYNSYLNDDIPASSLSQIIRLRAGNVIFNYRSYNNKLQRTEVTEDFTCPFCLVKCASFKGLRYHLSSSHDLLNFEFWVTEEYQAVNVSVKSNIWRYEIVGHGVYPKKQTFFICSRRLRRRKFNLLQNGDYSHALCLESDSPALACELNKANGLSTALFHSYDDRECIQSAPGSSFCPPAILHFAKTRKLSAERSDLRNRTLLHKRQFFHSHRAQPMELEQVLSDRDSEDEIDDDVADLEDQRMLDDFVDVTRDEKQLMHMWNSFVRRQRVLADGHIPWACEAFSRLHSADLVQSPTLSWCWRLFMIKLWNHCLLDARTMNLCNLIIEQLQQRDSDLRRS